MRNLFKLRQLGVGGHFSELLEKSAGSFALRVLDLGLGYGAIILATNLYGAKAFGVLAITMTIVNIAIVVPIFGLNGAAVKIIGQLVAKGESTWPTVKRALQFSGFLAIISALLLYFLAPFLAVNILNKAGMIVPLKTIAFAVLPLTLTAVVIGVLRGFKRTHLCSALPAVTRVLVIVALLISWGKFDLVILHTLSIVIAGLLVMIWFIRDQRAEAGTAVNMKRMLMLSFPMLLTSSFALIISWVDVLMIGSMMREEDVGLYTIAVRLAMLTSLGLISINTIAGPMFVEAFAKQDMLEFKRVVRSSSRLIMVVSLPVLGALLLFSDFALGIFGSEFIAAKYALTWLVLGQFVNSVCGSVGLVLQMTGGERVVMWIMVLVAAMNIGLNMLLIPVLGIEGGAIASMISVATWNLGMLVAVRTRLGFWITGIK